MYKQINIDKIVFQISYISIFLMYFNIIPINVETQPIIIILLIPFMFVITLFNNRVKLNKKNLLLITYILIIMVYFIFDILTGKNTFFDFVKLIAGPLSYLFILKNAEYINYKHIKSIIYVLFAFFLIQVLKLPLLENITSMIYNIFFTRHNDLIVGSARGVGILVPEPSYFVYFAILLLYSLDYLKEKDNITVKNLKILVIIMSLFTKSALVYIFLLIYFLKYINIRKLKSIFIMILVTIVTLVILNIFPSNRFSEVINKLIDDLNGGILNALFYSDASSGFRFIINSLYYLSIFIRPFGFGITGMANNWGKIAEIFNIDVWKNEHFKYVIKSNWSIDAQAYLANVVGTIGVFSIILFIFFFYRKKKMNSLQKNIYIVLFVYLVILQSNLFNPVFWLLFGILDSIDYYSNKNKNLIKID